MPFRIPFRQVNITSLAVLAACCAGFACGGPAATTSSGGSTRSTFEADRPFDDAPLTEAELSGNRRPQDRRTESAVPETPPAPTPPRAVRGYRVQIHSFRDRNTAETAISQLRRRFNNMGNVRIYIDHEPPYYKVRVGDFRSKADADRILKQLQSRKEYRDAWIVETMVKP